MRLGYLPDRVNGIHDMGGMHGFGPIVQEVDEPVFHATWEGRVLGMVYQLVGFGWTNLDAFRHAIERMDPVAYLRRGYYGRWLDAAERVAVEAKLLAAGDVAARMAGRPVASPTHVTVPGRAAASFVRTIDRAPRFA